MSKKNNKGTKRRIHAADLQKEKAELERKKKVIEKKEEKMKTEGGGVKKMKVTKPIRIRKGVRVKGIQVVDSETKKKARQLLRAEAALKMDIDDSNNKPHKKIGMKSKISVKVLSSSKEKLLGRKKLAARKKAAKAIMEE